MAYINVIFRIMYLKKKISKFIEETSTFYHDPTSFFSIMVPGQLVFIKEAFFSRVNMVASSLLDFVTSYY